MVLHKQFLFILYQKFTLPDVSFDISFWPVNSLGDILSEPKMFFLINAMTKFVHHWGSQSVYFWISNYLTRNIIS